MSGALEYLRKGQILLSVALGTVPVPLLLIAYMARTWLPYSWIFPLAYWILAMISLAVPGKLRLAYGLCAMLLLTLPGILLMGQEELMGDGETIFWTGVFYGVILLLSLQIGGWDSHRELHISVAGYCLVPHAIGQFLAVLDGTGGGRLREVGPWLTVSLFLFVWLIMLAMNRKSLHSAVGKGKHIPVMMRKRNSLLTAVLFFGAFLAAWIPSLALPAGNLVGQILGGLNWLLELLRPDMELPDPTQATTLPTETGGPGLIPDRYADPQVVRIVYIILIIVAVLVLLPLVVLELRRILRVLRRWLGLLWKWLADLSKSPPEEYYDDEITDTRPSDEEKRLRKQKKRERQRSVLREGKLTAAEKIRYRYRQLARKHPQWGVGSTARENLPEQAAVLYERARYSDHPVDEEAAERFKTETKKI